MFANLPLRPDDSTFSELTIFSLGKRVKLKSVRLY